MLAILVISLFVPALLATPLVRDGKIIGGTNATLGDYPYQVAILGSTLCGGSIISEWFVLTAAHCEEPLKSDYIVVAGSLNYNNADTGPGQIRGIASFTPHENYNLNTLFHDIALVKLKNPLFFDATVNAIQLATVKPTQPEPVIATGWGRTRSGYANSLPAILQTVTLSIVPFNTCNIAYGMTLISSSMVCAAGPGKDTCQGDSGGPLVRVQNGVFKQVGITSFGQGCADPDYPGVYTSVADHITWINTKKQTL